MRGCDQTSMHILIGLCLGALNFIRRLRRWWALTQLARCHRGRWRHVLAVDRLCDPLAMTGSYEGGYTTGFPLKAPNPMRALPSDIR